MGRPKRLTVVIPAAGEGLRMKSVMAAGRYAIPKPLLEVGRRPLILEILEKLERDLGSRGLRPRYRIVTGWEGGKLRRFLNAYYRKTALSRRLRFFTQHSRSGPLPAVLSARVRRGPMLVWLCDTLLDGGRPIPLREDCLYAGRVRTDPARWCLAEADAGGRLKSLADKPSAFPSRRPMALIGVYHLKRADLFHRAGAQALRGRARERGEYQLSAALRRYHSARPLKVLPVAGWLDAGSPETFTAAKERYLERLDSHKIELDFGRRRIVKSAAGGRRDPSLREEAAWYREAARRSPALRGSLPASVRLEGGRLILPYTDWPSLTDWYLYRSFYLPSESLAVFERFLAFVDRRLHRPAPGTAAGPEANRRMLVDKTEERLARLGRPALLRRRLRLNGEDVGSWRGWRGKFLGLARRYGAPGPRDWSLIHGDLVFSNVLADGRGGILLVDPRGSYGGRATAAGDRAYDYGKIAQCLFSHYDSIKKDEFELGGEGDRRRLAFRHEDAPGRRLWRASFTGFLRRQGIDPGRVRFFEAALLLSLLPLHRDHPRQVLAAYLLALRLLKSL